MKRGVRAIVTTREAEMRWTRLVRKTNAAGADGEVVWSWRPDAGVKRAERSAREGGKKARFPRESTKDTVKTIAQGRPDVRPILW